MLTDRFIFTLRDFVSDFIKETKTPLDMEYKTYEKQLNNTFDESTRAITADINKDIEWFSHEENRHLIQGFKKQGKIIHQHAIELSRHISDIKTKIKDETEIVSLQIDFCNRLQLFIDNLITKIEDITNDALTKDQIKKCHFDTLRSGITIEHLRQIYSNLLNQHWICRKHTSLNDFIYLFTGEGFATTKHIHWKVSTVKLSLFLYEIVADDKIWAKASHIFLVENKRVSKKVLGNSYSSAMGREITERRLKEIKTKITNVDLSYIQEAKRQSYLLD